MRTDEHIDPRDGHLRVPCRWSLDSAPKRDGWVPFFVNIDLRRDPQKIVIYKKAAA